MSFSLLLARLFMKIGSLFSSVIVLVKFDGLGTLVTPHKWMFGPTLLPLSLFIDHHKG